MTEYDFRTLSPGDFERLACDVLNTDLGLRLHSFPAGRDDGIDLREIADDGSTVVAQCKHYVDSSDSTFLRAIETESNKSAVKSAGWYLLVTSRPLSPGRETRVAGILGISVSDVWGPGRINRVLREHPEIERRHFKLWLNSTTVLSQVVNAGLWQRTEARLEEVASRIKYWAEIPAYAQARETLATDGVCVITGDPGVGKTFLAEKLMLDAVQEDWQIVDLSGGVTAAWAVVGNEGRRLLWIDDFLGQARLRHDAADTASELQDLVSFVRRNKSRLRLVLTAREQVLSQAAHSDSDRLRTLAIEPTRCRLAMSALNDETRIEILQNHLHFSGYPVDEAARDPRWGAVAAHPGFNPRLIRTAIEQRTSEPTRQALAERLTAALGNPAELWKVSFDVLDDLAQQIVLALASFPARPVSFKNLRSIASPDGGSLAWKRSLQSLEPTWITIIGTASRRAARFANPSCRDYLLGLLDDDDLARDCVADRLRQLEQLISISQAAGLLPPNAADPFTAPHRRGTLADVLMEYRTEFTTHLERWWHDWKARTSSTLGLTLLRLRDTAALLGLYGDAETSAWIVEEVHTLIDSQASRMPCVESLALARQVRLLPTVPDTLLHRLTETALGNAASIRDLDAYEDLPVSMATTEVRRIARRRAADIIMGELEALTHETTDPAVLEDAALELKFRAQWYEVDIGVDPVLDLIDRLKASMSSA
ncbi:restriction endonuclease [Catenulispora pinisilvae]|uniref:nSTAND3 domain-containing NTPase n=1 Tax=Catenulispora pinisilvae TaxID=2705253 RepID=UPI001891C4A3|nr:hypothetical protein [Catenulispora pinisilvae]